MKAPFALAFHRPAALAAALVSVALAPALARADDTPAPSRVLPGGYVNNAFGLGDQSLVLVNRSSGANYGRSTLGLPLGRDGVRAGASISRLDYGYSIDTGRFAGRATIFGADLAWPLLQSPQGRFTATAGTEVKQFANLAGESSVDRHSIRLATLNLSGDFSDDLLGGGRLRFSLKHALGQLDLGNLNDRAADHAAGGPKREGGFQRSNGSVSRLQRLSAADTLTLTAAGQFASRNLDGAEKFAATGPNGVRAYAPWEPAADNAALLALELRHQFGDLFSGSLFHDRAQLRRDRDINAMTPTANSYRLAGSGLGLSMGKPSDMLVRLTGAWRHGENPARDPVTGFDADGRHNRPHIFVTLLRTF